MKRFWDKVEKSSGCWLWKARKLPAGYGRFSIGHKDIYAHRMSWELANGFIPDGLCVLHSCDTPDCVRPKHLFLGTKAENNLDRDQKGRTASGDRHGFRLHPESVPRGSKHANSKLTERKVKTIRRLYSKGEVSQTDLARLFGVGQGRISAVVRRETWKHC